MPTSSPMIFIAACMTFLQCVKPVIFTCSNTLFILITSSLIFPCLHTLGSLPFYQNHHLSMFLLFLNAYFFRSHLNIIFNYCNGSSFALSAWLISIFSSLMSAMLSLSCIVSSLTSSLTSLYIFLLILSISVFVTQPLVFNL